MTRATTPPAARSKSPSDVGSALPCARATARSGASTWASGALATPLVILDMLDYALGKSRGRDLGRTGHQPREIVCDAARPDRPAEPACDRGRHIIPPELLEHHGPRQDHASRIHFVLPRVLGRGDYRVLVGTQHELREHRIGDAVLHHHLSRFPFPLSRVVFRDGLIPEPALRDLVPPLPEPALGELHDVAFVNERDRAATRTQRVLDRLRDQALGAELGHRLDADRAPGADLGREPIAEKSDDGIGLWAAGPVLDPGVHILDVLAENDHVELLRLAHRAGHALEVAHRPDAGVQVEQLAQGDVEGSDPPSDGGGQGALDRHAVCPDGVQGGIGKPVPDLLEGFLSRQHLEPIDLALPAGHFLDSGVEYAPGGTPDVGPGAVAFDEGDDGVARDHPTTVAVFDALAHGQAVYTARPGLRQAKRWPYTWGDASHTTADPIHAGGGLLARRGAGRCDAASRVGVPPSRLARIAPRPHRGAKGWAVLLRPDDRERGPRPLGSRPGAVARVARDGDAGTGPDVSVPVPAAPFPVVQPHPSPSERPRLI